MNRVEMNEIMMEQVIGGFGGSWSDKYPDEVYAKLGITVTRHTWSCDEYTLPNGKVVGYSDVIKYIETTDYKDSVKNIGLGCGSPSVF